MSPPSSIACRTLDAETTPVAARIRPARTRTALEPLAAARGSAMAALPHVRDDRGELGPDRDSENDAHERRRVVRGEHDEPDLRDDAERQEQAEAHLAAPDEVRYPEGQQRVQQGGEGIRTDEGRCERVLITHHDAREGRRRIEVRARHHTALPEDEGARAEGGPVRVLAFRVRAGGALEQDEA